MAIGFIGLGGMGQAIALNLLRAGHGMTVWNRSPAPRNLWQQKAPRSRPRPERCGKAETVFSMLADDHAARAVILDGVVLDTMQPGVVLVNHSAMPLSTASGRWLSVFKRAPPLPSRLLLKFGRSYAP